MDVPPDFVRGTFVWQRLTQFQKHYHSERNHQGKENVLLFPRAEEIPRSRMSPIECRERLGGLLSSITIAGPYEFLDHTSSGAIS
jgi:hypothetical protein